MIKSKFFGAFVAASIIFGFASNTAHAQAPAVNGFPPIKTRLDHFSGTKYILVLSYLKSEITSITCERWSMLGINSYKARNNFTIPSGPAVAIMDASDFDGYCKTANSIIAHTDDGDFVGALDRGPGNWTDSTKLTFTGAVVK